MVEPRLPETQTSYNNFAFEGNREEGRDSSRVGHVVALVLVSAASPFACRCFRLLSQCLTCFFLRCPQSRERRRQSRAVGENRCEEKRKEPVEEEMEEGSSEGTSKGPPLPLAVVSSTRVFSFSVHRQFCPFFCLFSISDLIEGGKTVTLSPLGLCYLHLCHTFSPLKYGCPTAKKEDNDV